jgi:hypothetical protein
MAFTLMLQDSFVSTGAAKVIPITCGIADYMVTKNITQMAAAPATAVVITSEWYRGMFADNDGIRWKKSSSTSVINIDTFATSTASNGFTYVPTNPTVEAAVTGTTITQANGAVCSATNTYSDGDRVRIYDSTGMLQIAGMDFTISSVSGSAFTLLGLDSSGFAAGATAFKVRRISKLAQVEPEFLYITKISKATQAVVTVSVAHSYVVGQLIRFSIASSMGMQEMNGLTGKITAVGTYTITVDIDSSSFTTFAFPASTATPTAQLFSTLAPAGQRTQYDPVTLVQTGYNFTYAPFHTGQFIPFMLLGGGAQCPAGAASDVIVYQIWRKEN